jgi:hypothetical protein
MKSSFYFAGLAVILSLMVVAAFFVSSDVTRLATSLILGVSLLAWSVLFSRPQQAQLAAIRETLQAYAIGDRGRRLPAESFGELRAVAAAVNDVGASLSEHDDPNLGPIRSTSRGVQAAATPDRKAPAPVSAVTTAAIDPAEAGVGEVRRLPRLRTPVPTTMLDEAKRQSAIPESVRAQSERPAIAAVHNDTVIDSASRLPEHAPTLTPLPAAKDLERLFLEFQDKRQAAGLDDDGLDFPSFADTVASESERLLAEHQCRAVRFDILVADGDVSLRPRLIR